MSYFYLATPYSKYAAGIEAAYREACLQAAVLIRAGIPVLSPITHSHGIAIHGDVDAYDHRIWMPLDLHLMEAARGLIVCELDGWRDSYGVQIEISEFTRMRKPIVYMTPGCIPQDLLTQGEKPERY